VRTPEGRQAVGTGNLIVAQFHHDTSREKDPQLHTHCVVINATQLNNGRWQSLHNDILFKQQKLLGMIYQNELAVEVQRLGYGIEPRANGQFELGDIDPTTSRPSPNGGSRFWRRWRRTRRPRSESWPP
jgi:conjugative relaxase-like TrwC/TraI family protein